MILFITRKYPPSVGGMQKLSHYLTATVALQARAQIIKWGGSQRWLPFFIPYALVRALLVLATQPVGLIHIGDPVLAPLGLFLRFVARRPVVVNAHGWDVIYPNRLYQAIVPACLRRLDFVICISEHTRQQCVARDVDPSRTIVIPVGVNAEEFTYSVTEAVRTLWIKRWGIEPCPKHILLTVGRLVHRKGVHFFVSEVLPELAERRSDWVYLVAGDGPERRQIEVIARSRGLDDMVRLLGRVPNDELRAAYALADLFVMPNVPVAGDCEGFGLVTLEARVAGVPVVASSLEGIDDSFASADDGVLVPPGDVRAFVEAIDGLLQNELTIEARLRRRKRVKSRYGWEHIGEEYLTVFRAVQARHHSPKNKGIR